MEVGSWGARPKELKVGGRGLELELGGEGRGWVVRDGLH